MDLSHDRLPSLHSALTVIIYALSFTLGALVEQRVRPKLVNILTNLLTLQIFSLDTRIGSTGRV